MCVHYKNIIHVYKSQLQHSLHMHNYSLTKPPTCTCTCTYSTLSGTTCKRVRIIVHIYSHTCRARIHITHTHTHTHTHLCREVSALCFETRLKVELGMRDLEWRLCVVGSVATPPASCGPIHLSSPLVLSSSSGPGSVPHGDVVGFLSVLTLVWLVAVGGEATAVVEETVVFWSD